MLLHPRPLLTPIPPTSRPLPTTVPAVNSLALSKDNQPQQKNKDQKKPTSSTSSTPENKPNSIASLLGPDGKLTPEECKRRLDNKLCLRCGKTGHMVSDCPQSTKPKAKARAATTATPTTTPAAATGAGKA